MPITASNLNKTLSNCKFALLISEAFISLAWDDVLMKLGMKSRGRSKQEKNLCWKRCRCSRSATSTEKLFFRFFYSPNTVDLWLVSNREVALCRHFLLFHAHSRTKKLAKVTYLSGRSLRLRLFRNWAQKSQFLRVNAVLYTLLYTLQCLKLHIYQLLWNNRLDAIANLTNKCWWAPSIYNFARH